MSYKNLSNISEYSFMEITYILFTFIYKFYFLPTSFSPSPSLFPLFTSLFSFLQDCLRHFTLCLALYLFLGMR